MAIAILDINDSNLQLWHGDTHLQSPGYALLDGRQYRFGNPARAAARLRPRDINTRFWWQLSTESLQPALGPARHSGDLVHAQLQELHREGGQPGELLMAVSGSMQRDQLALLLGIAQQCPFKAVGLVNRSVALGSLYGGPGRLFHLEIQLHQAVISELANSAGRVELQRTVPLPGCGLLQLQEKLVEIIAAAFIRQTRFDPRRKAATEQLLYDALPEALRTLGTDSETNLEVSGYRTRISRSELLLAGQRLFDSAPEILGSLRAEDRIIVDPVAALLPGLREHFAQLEVLQSDSIRLALQQHQDQLVQREEALSFVTSLPCLQQSIAPRTPAPDAVLEPEQPAVAVTQPTHLLERDRARPLLGTGTDLAPGCEIYRANANWQLRGADAGVMVNGIPYSPGQPLRSGDVIRTGAGIEARLIEVAPGG
jgi:hypothetical protein